MKRTTVFCVCESCDNIDLNEYSYDCLCRVMIDKLL